MATDPTKATQDKFKNQDLRTMWRTMKTKAINEFKARDPEGAKKLSGEFDKGLGPLLDKWDQETAKWPKYDAKKLGDIGKQAANVIEEYKKAGHIPGGKENLIIQGALNGIAGEMTRRLKWYNNPTL
jgi:DNA polymerase/3'-5' exonuclease PolX